VESNERSGRRGDKDEYDAEYGRNKKEQKQLRIGKEWKDEDAERAEVK
jgi:hypothetical protein